MIPTLPSFRPEISTMTQLRHFDVFNGDADGLCALHQLRLVTPRASILVTGTKREINLLEHVVAQRRRLGDGARYFTRHESRRVDETARERRECRVLRPSLCRRHSRASSAACVRRYQSHPVHEPDRGSPSGRAASTVGDCRGVWRQSRPAGAKACPSATAWLTSRSTSCANWERASTTTPTERAKTICSPGPLCYSRSCINTSTLLLFWAASRSCARSVKAGGATWSRHDSCNPR